MRTHAGTVLDQHGVAVGRELFDGLGGAGDTGFAGSNLGGYADFHWDFS
jgi:hypothetical protein